jgi:ribosomal protein S18 acetylase RimI-like enzyme
MVWRVQVSWFADHDLVPLVQAVAATGGAVGWLTVPSAEEVVTWASDLAASGARFAIAGDASEVLGCGAWTRLQHPVLAGMAVISKVMTHPSARGKGVARAVMELLVADAGTAGVELLTLDCRGNNHAAQRLYASLGFVVTGRRPDAIAVGDERFDQVLMHLDLRVPGSFARRGSRREGPGAT